MFSDNSRSFNLDQLAHEIYESLAFRFPVCLGSDEFHYFPHYRSSNHDWSKWDDFSPGSVEDVIEGIYRWESQLRVMSFDQEETDIEAATLSRLLVTLREQLTLFRFHEIQPTFYLTIAGVGLTEALDVGREAFSRRMDGLPKFLEHAMKNISRPPRLYIDLGVEMAEKICQWLRTISEKYVNSSKALEALKNFKHGLKSIKTIENFPFAAEGYAHIARHHMDCRASTDEIEEYLTEETKETEDLMNRCVDELRPGVSWQELLAGLGTPDVDHRKPHQAYKEIIMDLYIHCREQAFLTAGLIDDYQVRIEEIPDCMRPVRSDAAFSMPPGNPPGTGTFYILPHSENKSIPADYRLLSAHETYPGHQLLDTCRWLLPDPMMRSLEFPVFYEGWASFSEEILFDTGFFSNTTDRFLMAKRRYWRAQRGLIDLRINTGRWNLSFASEYLTSKGLPQSISRGMVRRYALKPGYQLAYTMGRRGFKKLYNRYRERGGGIGGFVRAVMGSGEVGFDDLEQMLNKKEIKN